MMFEKIGLWLLVAVAEKLAHKYLTIERGADRRTQLVDYLIGRAQKAQKSKTEVDNGALSYFAGLLKSERLGEALK